MRKLHPKIPRREFTAWRTRQGRFVAVADRPRRRLREANSGCLYSTEDIRQTYTVEALRVFTATPVNECEPYGVFNRIEHGEFDEFIE
jgi:hypothetical protein